MPNLLLGVQRINRSDDAAKRSYRMERDCIFRKIRTENSKDLALFETAFPETGSHTRNSIGKFGVFDRATARPVDQRRLIATLLRALKHERSNRNFGNGDLWEW